RDAGRNRPGGGAGADWGGFSGTVGRGGCMSLVSFDAIWGAIPYPALIVGMDNTITAANPAAENFGATSLRVMSGKPLARFIGDNSALFEVIAQARRDGVSVAQYDVMIGWGDQPPEVQNVHAAPLDDAATD